jgi:hypothetical protein
MLGEDIKKLKDKMVELSEAKKGVKAPKYTKKAKGTMADDDYDGDGNIETGKEEYLGSKIAAAKKAGKMKEGAMCKKCDCDPCECDDVKKEGKGDGNLANNAKPYDKVTQGDVVAGRLGKDAKGGKDKKATEGATKTDKPWTDMSGKKHPGTAVKGDKYTGKEAEKDAKATKEGKDEGKPGKNFAKIAKAAGGGEKGNKIAGKVRADLAKKGKLEEGNFKHNVRFVNESLQFLLAEDEEGKAKAITAAGDMVNDYTSWMQRVGQYQTKTMIELADAIKADFGAAEAEAFKAAVGPALSQTLEVLTQQREAVSNAVAVLAGEATPEEPMGMEPGMDQGMDMPPEPGMDMSAPDEMNPDMGGDEFGAADAAAGGPEAAGRAMRESKFARKLAESHSIMSKLAK